MRRVLAAAIVMMGAGAAVAQDAEERWDRHAQPTYFQVGPLAPGDMLVIRAAPSADARELGALAPGVGPIEVVGVTRTGQTDWAEIAYGGERAFVARRFLDQVAPPVIGGTAFPMAASCFGTEPFWSIQFAAPNEAVFDALAYDAPDFFTITDVTGALNRIGLPARLTLDGEFYDAELTVDTGWCSDGMSDVDYPWRASLYLGRDGGVLLDGCCSVQLPYRATDGSITPTAP